MSTTISLKNETVPVEAPGIDDGVVQKALDSKPFQEWKKTVEDNPRIRVKKITLQSIDMFGPRVGFIKFNADAEVNGKWCPGIVFMRGASVARPPKAVRGPYVRRSAGRRSPRYPPA